MALLTLEGSINRIPNQPNHYGYVTGFSPFNIIVYFVKKNLDSIDLNFTWLSSIFTILYHDYHY
jgi:hypothetical protein